MTQATERTFDLIQENELDSRTLYRFRTAKKNLVDFQEGCVFNQVAKESSFTHHDIVSCTMKTGQITLAEQTLTVTENGVHAVSELSAEDRVNVLQNVFKLYV